MLFCFPIKFQHSLQKNLAAKKEVFFWTEASPASWETPDGELPAAAPSRSVLLKSVKRTCNMRTQALMPARSRIVNNAKNPMISRMAAICVLSAKQPYVRFAKHPKSEIKSSVARDFAKFYSRTIRKIDLNFDDLKQFSSILRDSTQLQ